MRRGFLDFSAELGIAVFGAGVAVLLLVNRENFFANLLLLVGMIATYSSAFLLVHVRLARLSERQSGIIAAVVIFALPILTGVILQVGWQYLFPPNEEWNYPILFMLLWIVAFNLLSMFAAATGFEE